MDLNYNTVKGVHIYGILLDMMGKLEHIKKLAFIVKKQEPD